jgi:hypothetical protein
METYLHIIQAVLSDWFIVTLNNPVYAGALAIAVFLLTATLYSIKIASLKEKTIASEKARIEMEKNLNASLNTAQQKMLLMQEELAANTGQMEQAKQLAQKEADLAAGLEKQLSQRNSQVAGIIQSLATSFDLGERPLLVMGDIKAEDLWQQHNRVITLLTTRLQSEQQAKTQLQQSYQAETVKRAENEALIETLQTTLATQTSQFSKLEQALEEQKNLLQQQHDKAQQVLSRTLEKHLSELARLTELEQQSLDLVNTRQQLTQLEVKLNTKEAQITQLEQSKPADQIKVQPQPAPIEWDEKETPIDLKEAVEDVPPAPLNIKQPPVSPVKGQFGGATGKFKNLFGKTKQEPIIAVPETVITKKEESKIQPLPVEVKQSPASTGKDQLGKLKNLFGSKQKSEDPIQEEPETQPASVELEQSAVSATKGQLGKLKNLFGSKLKSEETKPEKPEIQLAPVELEQSAVSATKSQLGKLKNLFGSKLKSEETKLEKPEIQPVPVQIEQPPVSPTKGRYGKSKYYFGDIKQQPEVTKQDETLTQPTALEVEQLPVNASKDQLGKLKNLFGKKK